MKQRENKQAKSQDTRLQYSIVLSNRSSYWSWMFIGQCSIGVLKYIIQCLFSALCLSKPFICIHNTEQLQRPYCKSTCTESRRKHFITFSTSQTWFHLLQKQNNEFQSGEGKTASLVCTCICCEKHEFPAWPNFVENRWTVLHLSERKNERDYHGVGDAGKERNMKKRIVNKTSSKGFYHRCCS